MYPTIPKGDSGHFLVEELMSDGNNKPVEDYLAKIEACIEKHKIDIRPGEEFSELSKNQRGFSVVTRENQY